MIINSLVLSEAVLVAVSIAVAFSSTKKSKALSMACILIASAALLGLLRYSGVLILPELHQLFAALGSCVALPLIAVNVIWPDSSVSRNVRYMVIFSFITAFLSVILVTINEFELWRNVCAGLSTLLILFTGFVRKEWLNFLAGILLLLALIILIKKINILILLPADSMHLLLAATLLIVNFSLLSRTKKVT